MRNIVGSKSPIHGQVLRMRVVLDEEGRDMWKIMHKWNGDLEKSTLRWQVWVGEV